MPMLVVCALHSAMAYSLAFSRYTSRYGDASTVNEARAACSLSLQCCLAKSQYTLRKYDAKLPHSDYPLPVGINDSTNFARR